MTATAVIDIDADRKTYATLRARLALAGYGLCRSDLRDGPASYYVTRWGRIVELRSLDAVAEFARAAGCV